MWLIWKAFFLNPITNIKARGNKLPYVTSEFQVQMECFFIAEFERAAKIRKIAVDRS